MSVRLEETKEEPPLEISSIQLFHSEHLSFSEMLKLQIGTGANGKVRC